MIDFRYHLVSIVSVFLALALGIVIGTTALNGRLPGDLESRVAGLTADKRGLEGDLMTQKGLTAADDEVLGQLTTELVQGRLAGQRVLLVSAPGAPSGVREQLEPVLVAAGATVSAEVQLRQPLTDPARRDELTGVLGASAQDPLGQVLDKLAVALVGREGRRAVDDAEATQILGALQSEGLIQLNVTNGDALAAPADLAVLLVADAVTDPDPGQQDTEQGTADTLSMLAAALDRRDSGTVVAGARPGGRGVLEQVRGSDALSAVVTTVDGIDGPRGRLVTVLALLEQECGRSGRYGSGSGTDGALPRPCPP